MKIETISLRYMIMFMIFINSIVFIPVYGAFQIDKWIGIYFAISFALLLITCWGEFSYLVLKEKG